MSETYKAVKTFFANRKIFKPSVDKSISVKQLGGERVVESLLKAGFIEKLSLEVVVEAEDVQDVGADTERVNGFFLETPASLKDMDLEMLNVRISEIEAERRAALNLEADPNTMPVAKTKKEAIAYLGRDLQK